MNWWRLLDWVWHWRSNVCWWAGILLALLACWLIPWPAPACIAAVGLVLTGLIVGFRWDRSNRF